MTSHDHKAFIDRIKKCLRDKREQKEEHPTCTLQEIFNTMSTEDKSKFQHFQSPEYLHNTFREEIKNNPKIHFDIGRKQFSFINKFRDAKDLVNKLYHDKVGVIENQELYDDIDKETLVKLKQEGIMREITIAQNKTRPPLIILYVRHEEDEIEKMDLERNTNQKLKDLWSEVDQDEVESTMLKKRMNQAFQTRDEPRLRRTEKKKKRRERNENDISDWRNRHIRDRIEEAMKVLNQRAATDKKGFRRPGMVNGKGGDHK